MTKSSIAVSKLDYGATRRVSGYIRACMEKHKISAEEFTLESGSGVHPKTLNAMLTLQEDSTRRWEAEKAYRLFAYACQRNFAPPARMWAAIVDGVRTVRPFDSEAAFLQYYHFSHRMAKKLHGVIASHERRAKLTRFFGRVLTNGCMPERMIRDYLRGRYAGNDAFDDRVLEGIRRFERDRSEAMIESSTTGTARHERYLAHFEFRRMLSGDPPYHLVRVEDIEEFVEQLQDFVSNEKIIFGLTHGAPTRGDGAYRWLLHFESVILMDDDLLIRHEAHKPYTTIVERQAEPSWNLTLDYRIRQMATLPRRTTHKLDPESTKQAIDDAVRKYLDPRR